MAQVAGRAGKFKLLPIAAGEDFDLGADGAFVVVQALQVQPQPVILISAFIAQQDCRAMILRDQKIGGAVVVVVTGDDSAGIFELNLVQADVGCDIFESVGAKVAEETNLPFAVFGFSYRDEVNPAVVIIIEGGDAGGACPIEFRQRNLFEVLALVVAPQA